SRTQWITPHSHRITWPNGFGFRLGYSVTMGREYRTHAPEPPSPNGLVLPRTRVSSCPRGGGLRILSAALARPGGWPIPLAPFCRFSSDARAARDLAVGDVERSLAFYDSVLGPLGLKEKFRNLTYRRTEEVVYLEYGVQGFGLRPADGGVYRHYEVGIEHLAFEVD